MSSNFNRYQTNNNANWESQMLYTEQARQQKINQSQENSSIYKPRAKQEAAKLPKNKTFKNLAKIAVVSSALVLGVDKFNEHIVDPHTTVDSRVSQIDAKDGWIDGLDNQTLSQEEINNRTMEAPSTITLRKEDTIRSNDWTYIEANHGYFEAHPDSPTHTSMLVTDEDLTFNITQGQAIRGYNGDRIGLRIENFEKTADGKYTGLKMDADKDGWVFVDLPKDEE